MCSNGEPDCDEPDSQASRLRRRLRRFDPARIGWLGLLAVPGHLVDSLAFMQLFGLLFLFFLWPLVEPLVDLALKRQADDVIEPTGWIYMGDWREWAVAYLMLPTLFLNPLVLVQDLLQLLGSGVAVVRHRGSIPGVDERRLTAYRLPVEGTWTVVNGGLEKTTSHSWIPANQRYAYDFIITDAEGRSRPAGTDPSVERYYCYDEPVFAPADGVVVDVLETDLEPARGGGFSHSLKRDIRGNYITIQHAPDEFSCLAHLVPGSVSVSPGERVKRGQRIARCGHTGNSSEPHLHFQVQDHPVFELAAGVPVVFEDVTVESPWLADMDDTRADAAGSTSAESSGVDRPATAITAGQRVTTVGAADRMAERVDGTVPADSRSIVTVERAAFGVIVGGVLASVAGFGVGPIGVSLTLTVAALVGIGVRLLAGRGDGERVRRPGGIGTTLGITAVTVAWASVPLARSPLGVVLVGLCFYVAAAGYDRFALADPNRAPPAGDYRSEAKP
jgi:hypothetical protein